MANAIYPKYKEALLDAFTDIDINMLTAKVALIDTGAYTYNSAHDFWDDVPGGAVIGTPQTLTSKSVTNGVFDAGDVTFTSVSGNTVEALIIYIDTGTASTSRLVAYIDTGVTGLPLTPNGGNVTITWNASGIFAL